MVVIYLRVGILSENCHFDIFFKSVFVDLSERSAVCYLHFPEFLNHNIREKISNAINFHNYSTDCTVVKCST